MKKSIKKMNILNVVIFIILISLPFLLIGIVAWKLGYFDSNIFIDPCIAKVQKGQCLDIKGCEWLQDKKKCIMTSKCTNIRSQQNCAEGCTWDPNVRRYNSNIYGFCRPDFRLSKEEVGESSELKQ